MQDKRHGADYDPSAPFAVEDVLRDITDAEERIAAFAAALERDRRAFVALILFRRRP